MRIFVKKKLKNKNLYQIALRLYTDFHEVKKTLFGKKKNYSLKTFKSFCYQKNLKYVVLEKETYRESYIPKYFKDDSEPFIKKERLPEIYYCEINNASVVGGNSFVISENYCLNDIPFQSNSENYNLNYGSVLEINKNKLSIDISFMYNRTIIEKGISIVGHAANNYYHFTIDLLSRLYYIDQVEEYKDYPLLIDERACEYYSNLINAVNKNKREVIPIKRNVMYNVVKLVYPSMVSWNPIYRVSSKYENSGNYYANKPYLMFKELKNKIGSTSEFPERKVFISRKDVSRNYLKNESDVARIFSEHGFEIISPGELDFERQIKLFSQVKVLAGAEGAAFTNMIYMPTGSKVLCISPKEKNKYMVSTLAYINGLECEYLDPNLINENDHYMDLDYLRSFLESVSSEL